ncbi:F-box only protein 41-like [Carassius gibelio]|uniref:F-box only protein 41-like n=1 Tax=Carassius gibelio TaxID=101364 RepID=UPI0022796E1D|nr:F-box only protein 41-like [Carassius gibelio]
MSGQSDVTAMVSGNFDSLGPQGGASLLLFADVNASADGVCYFLQELSWQAGESTRPQVNRSASDPAGQEVIWALGAGCRNITTLHIAPLQPCLQPSRFSNRCLQTIGRCWPNLCRVGVGGASCGVQGLASLARNCVNLCELELHHMNEVNQESAAEICRDGLQQLHTLSFISTPVTSRALLHFSSVCVSLKCVLVQLSISDYFEDADSEEAKRLFEEIINNLQALRKRPALSDVLQIRVKKP